MPRFILPPRGTFRPNNGVDPLPFYYKPVVGRIFVARFDAALSLLSETRFHRLLELGYGSGLLLPTLDRLTDDLVGADLEVEPPGLVDTLTKLGTRPMQLVQADARKLPFPDGHFDGVVALSILEHLRADILAAAAAELGRVTAPNGLFLAGCPAVHKAMNAAFAVIGFQGIENHHFSSLPDVVAAMKPWFSVEARSAWPAPLAHAPLGWAPYGAVLFRRHR